MKVWEFQLWRERRSSFHALATHPYPSIVTIVNIRSIAYLTSGVIILKGTLVPCMASTRKNFWKIFYVNSVIKYTMKYVDFSIYMCIMDDNVINARALTMPQVNELYGFTGREMDGRRKPQEDRSTFNVKQLWQRSHEIINLAAQGMKQIDIARVLCVTPQCVSNTLNSDLGIAKLSDLRQSRDEEAKLTTERIRYLTSRALDVYSELFDNENGEATLKDRKDGARDVLLELSGLRAATTVHAVHTTLTMEEIEAMKSRGRSYIDITPKENENE